MQIQHVSLAAPATSAPTPADRLEQVFLEEMLKYCGPRAAEGAFAGGATEQQFESFLTREYAAILSEKLDLGFADMIAGDAQ
ncbi:rod-binding protein [Paracoccus sp. YLB-12]|uniref:Rod-binding protein n=1 Tax=Paracoccus maritimus TaxID=2933292 RepID=A0ABT2KC08_9RHOB|nr:rod-binding protein [Paracoccus sp. YLB-12]MCT4334065.1 rod-binding protein [Paracoccus sp. YLB-12]